MANSYSPAARSFGRRIRVAYVATIVLLFAARMWSVHGVLEFLDWDADHGQISRIAGRLPGQPIKVTQRVLLHIYAPQVAPNDDVGQAIDTWYGMHDQAARLLLHDCARDNTLCRQFGTLGALMHDVAAAARAVLQAPAGDRPALVARLKELQSGYSAAATAWVDELAARFMADIAAQRQTLIMWAIGQLIVGALLVVIIVEPVIRRLQRERSEGDREQAVRQELLSRLQKMAGQLPGMVYQFRLRPDGTSHFPYSSEGIRQIYGVSPESVQDDAGGVFAVLHPDDTARVREAILLSAARLTHWRDEYRVCLPDGRERWVLGNAAPEREPDSGILWHGFITDVTERRNAMQAIADARTLLQSVLDAATEAAIIATDVTGRITVFNSGAERMLQYQSAEMVGRLNPLVDQQAESPAHERPYVRKDGTRLTVSRSVTAIRNADGGINGYLSVATDVTERLEARESLQAAKDTAERANRAKSEFLATMSHEIRTPMNGVLGFANLLKDTKLDAEQRDFVRTIESSGQILLAIINDILDFSKIEAGAMTLERIPFDLAPAVDEVAVMMQGKAEEKNLELVLSLAPNVPSRVVTDPGRLKQVLINLINNAIKFTSAGSVRVEVGVDGGERLQFSVQDTGIGIAPAAQAALFQKFSQADASTTRRYGGTGLGLAICRQLVELMGGRIGVESMPGCGSRFWFTIPLQLPGPTEHAAESRAAARSLAATVPAAGEPARVLIAEDNPVNQMVAMRLLKRLGCRVDVAHNGAEAVQMATRLPYSAIFMDCHMPEMDGFEAARAIRRRENALGLSSTAIIALTASVLQEDRERCLSAGMDDIIGKPVQIADLAKVLRRFVVVDVAQE